ncbi:hypothetical protein RHGRI_038142 [Rhododendron griersonianum]|uniref:Uncharacterized protein n=1 Tax=Rhododendron griersonianum TaxID=479676 RepID=A0AAV6HXZ7_9ERIC|nr:hypothetical protein RHGRI_038142 [Rhododendron griersonianum]
MGASYLLLVLFFFLGDSHLSCNNGLIKRKLMQNWDISLNLSKLRRLLLPMAVQRLLLSEDDLSDADIIHMLTEETTFGGNKF